MQSTRACDYCRYRKRKCDRELPLCSLCVHNGQTCHYSKYNSPISPNHSESGVDEAKSLQTSIPERLSTDFPSVYFIDHEVFQQSKISLSIANLPLDAAIIDGIERPALITAKFFTWVHLWMPIISKSRFLLDHTGPLARPTSDVKILLFCMKLIMWSPKEAQDLREPINRDYLAAKNAFLMAEVTGILTLQLLQAMILTAIYEYAHAIYPAAYITIGVCARYGIALGINKQCKEDLVSTTLDLEDQEERRRVWWAIIILDRVVSHWMPTSPDPRAGDLLPVNDQAWDDGNIDISRISPVSSPSNTNMGMFARLSQAAYLLGRVQRHLNAPTGDVQFDREERAQLGRSLRALLNLTYIEGATEIMPICPQTAICFNALIRLHSSSQLSEYKTQEIPVQVIIETLNILRPIAQESLLNANLFFRREPWSLEKSSPLLLHWAYSAAVAFLKADRCLRFAKVKNRGNFDLAFPESNREEVQQQVARGLQTMKLKLALLGHQWSAADEYLRILEAREIGDMV